MTAVSSQTSGAQRRLQGACESQTRAAPAYALRASVLASRLKYRTTRRREAASPEKFAKSWTAKSFYLGHVQLAARVVLLAVPSESDFRTACG